MRAPDMLLGWMRVVGFHAAVVFAMVDWKASTFTALGVGLSATYALLIRQALAPKQPWP